MQGVVCNTNTLARETLYHLTVLTNLWRTLPLHPSSIWLSWYGTIFKPIETLPPFHYVQHKGCCITHWLVLVFVVSNDLTKASDVGRAHHPSQETVSPINHSQGDVISPYTHRLRGYRATLKTHSHHMKTASSAKEHLISFATQNKFMRQCNRYQRLVSANISRISLILCSVRSI